MHTTLRQMRVFTTVASHLNYTRAARELHLSQPAVSMQVKQLEESVGLPLFEHAGKKIQLTEAGKEMYQYVRTIFQTFEEMEEVLDAMKGLDTGHINIAVASTVNYFAPRLLAGFSRQYPGIDLSLDVTNRERLMGLLKNNEIDIVLMGLPPEDIDLIYEPFMDNPLVVIAPPGHPLEKRRQIPMHRLEEEIFIMREAGSGTRLAMERYFKEQGITIRTGMQMTRNEAIKQAVRAGMGLGVVSTHTIELEVETGRLVILDIEGFPILRHWYMVYRKTKRLSPPAKAFHDFVMAEAQHIREAPI
ncbi:MAG: LysR family transcriptional regulator [gamma proteobacterium symbiont of Ctena orbiculata]|uniref:LysR family transcriptional regulator n=1 Tax=Candidatus Thiodiazotropha taylori TaxID=2792791 RepID=A0A944M810_9GAMM|nr:LysR family transcriptional regulator [Candidatus Thiodiazotropha taylori]PUB86564.1 MAG: LysR family transcriptional regulator [gamma proteobacterium symbiont of Ctena orbiculata]MBT2987939.1 LysR family transcriptional regulator [Candidatus Thiodiazotropha taylori]MBT2997584.1 LysR family transcriptional regulator [Candidatus Thiodiazotropha taylori]MBT2998990.1 LysR family transcriptional regulator [Candidatus Thiodiazotropha taylori]